MQSQGAGKACRPWQVIAAEVSNEHDSEKLKQLVRELIEALDEQGLGTLAQPVCGKTANPKDKFKPIITAFRAR
jgi:hypothetical protein